MPIARPYTQEEEEFLAEFYPDCTVDIFAIAQKLNRTIASIRRRASFLGIHRERSRYTVNDKKASKTAARLRFLAKNPNYNQDYHQSVLDKCEISGICAYCDSPKLSEDKTRCLRHWVLFIARKSCKNQAPEFVQALVLKLENQQFKCAMTGIELIPGKNTHLDHIIPKSRGGSHEIDNLRWVDHKMNYIKYDLLDVELIKYCEMILKYRSDNE